MDERGDRAIDFHGVEFGAPREQATASLTASLRRLDGDATATDRSDPLSGGTVHVEGATWTAVFSYDDHDRVCSHAALWRKRPAGHEASLAWISARVRAWGPPERVALLAPAESRPVEAVLEWPTPTGYAAVTLLRSEGAWDIREDLHPYPLQRDGQIALREHRARLAALSERLASQPANSGWLGAYCERTATWVRARDTALAWLEPRIGGAGVVDVVDAAARAMSLLDALASGLPACDGAFLVIHTPGDRQRDALRDRLWTLARAAGLSTTQLTGRPLFEREPTTGEPLPPPPPVQIHWLESPLAARLLREELLGAVDPGLRCEVVPASLTTVDDAVEEWLRVPPPAASPRSWKYAKLTRTLRPLRLVHPPTGEAVHLDHGEPDELRRYAHALLAARLAAGQG